MFVEFFLFSKLYPNSRNYNKWQISFISKPLVVRQYCIHWYDIFLVSLLHYLHFSKIGKKCLLTVMTMILIWFFLIGNTLNVEALSER